MTTRASDIKRDFDASVDPWFEDYPVVASDIIYEGSAVTLDASGRANPGVKTDTYFVGMCAKQADNSAGAASAINAKVRTQGKVNVPVTGVTGIVDVGKKVYIVDDDTFSLTATGHQFGKIVRHISSTTCMVYFQADPLDVNT